MLTNRRTFLQTAGLVAWGLNVPAFLSRTAAAAPMPGKKGSKDTILVVVELTGSNDGLNTVVPFKDPQYAKLRPTLKLAEKDLKKINDEIGMHPSMTGFAELLQDKSLCVVQGVGYPNPSQSHFRSMDVWQGGSLDKTISEGWIGKAMKKMKSGTSAFHLKQANQSSPLAYEGAPNRVPSIASLEEFTLQTAAASSSDKKEQQKVIESSVAKKKTDKPNFLDFVPRTPSNTYDATKRPAEIGKNYQPKATYPETALANKLKLAAQLIDADLGARIFYVSIDGFDTHATQAPAHAALWTQVSGAMTAFFKDVKARGNGDRVLMMTFSEFGRRAKENGSKGTDHGSGAPMFLIGGKAKAGAVGKHPSLTDLDDGNLKFDTDFRQVYASILDKWLGVAHKDVLGKEFKPADVFKS